MLCDIIPREVRSLTERAGTAGERATPASETGERSGAEFWSRVRAWWARRSVNEAAYVRQSCGIRATYPEFELLAERSGAGEGSWATYGLELLDRAEWDQDRGAIDEVWRNLNTARRFEIYGLDRLAEGPSARGAGRNSRSARSPSVRRRSTHSTGGDGGSWWPSSVTTRRRSGTT